MTRLGMKEEEMSRIAEFFNMVLNENKDVSNEVREFRREFREVKYCFEVEKYEDYLMGLYGGC